MGSRHAGGLALHVRSYHAVASYRGLLDFLKTAIDVHNTSLFVMLYVGCVMYPTEMCDVPNIPLNIKRL